ncbi:MAG: sialate O-acetylesterase [Kiritimatiellales bacterium]
MKFAAVLMSFVAMTAFAGAELWMPSIFGNGMVLQSGMPVPVWGEADPGAEVTVEFAGQKKTAVTSNSGKWRVTLDPLQVSSSPKELSVHSTLDTRHLSFPNVLVGEVWVLSGQSNMGIPLTKCDGGEAAAAKDYPWLHIFRQWPFQGASDAPARDVTGGQWTNGSSKQVAGLSGVGFFFARALQAALPEGTPVALINTQMGGTYIECWIDSNVLKTLPSAQPYIEKAKKETALGKEGPGTFLGEKRFMRPSALFNGKVAPIQPFAARGVIWYQGEGNAAQWLYAGYAESLRALINSWRDGWQRPDLPFLIVQLPRYTADRWNHWPEIRAAQAQVANRMSNVDLAVTIDCGEKDQIHPRDKEPVGERLALLARANVYGQQVACSGPVFQTLEISDGDAAYLTFTNSAGLILKNGSAGFEICGPDGKFTAAQAEILKDGRVKVFSPEVSSPTAVRYAWFNWGEVSLFNGAGLPAAPFTTVR